MFLESNFSKIITFRKPVAGSGGQIAVNGFHRCRVTVKIEHRAVFPVVVGRELSARTFCLRKTNLAKSLFQNSIFFR